MPKARAAKYPKDEERTRADLDLATVMHGLGNRVRLDISDSLPKR